MEELNRAKTVVDFYIICSKLKDIIRTGWKTWQVQRERIESVAEHIYKTQMLAIMMHSQFGYNFDLNKIVFMIAIHELEENIIGDKTCFQMSEEERQIIGHKAVEEILSNILNKEQIQNLILEFDARETEEAKFAYHCDKLDWDIQSKIYDEEGCVDLNHQENNPIYQLPVIQNLIQNGATSFSDICLDFDRSKFEDDKNFMEVWQYVRNNRITK